MMSQYRARLDDIINLTRARLELEDLNECIETKIPSEKYIQLLEFLDQVRQNYSLESILFLCVRFARTENTMSCRSLRGF